MYRFYQVRKLENYGLSKFQYILCIGFTNPFTLIVTAPLFVSIHPMYRFYFMKYTSVY